MLDDEHMSTYKWEEAVSNNWDNDIQEDESGRIVNVKLQSLARGQVHRRQINESVRRGLIRYMVFVLDCSASAAEKDYRPNRIMAMKSASERFILHFFDQNPISQLCLSQIQDGVARKLTDMSGNPKVHLERLRKVRVTKGVSSLQNAMKLAISALRHVPSYGHRELLIVYASMSTTDPGSIEDTIKDVIESKIRVSIVCLNAEIYVCSRIAKETGGSFAVAVDSKHLGDILREWTIPTPQLREQCSLQTDFVYMGFPRRVVDATPSYVFDGKVPSLSCTAYVCPRCHTRAAEIPTQCSTCTLQLNSSSHIARSFHHIFPVPQYEEVAQNESGELYEPTESLVEGKVLTTVPGDRNPNPANEAAELSKIGAKQTSMHICAGCSELVDSEPGALFKCGRCLNVFCMECDKFVHESLHNCPGCV